MRTVYVADTMIDVRMLEGFAADGPVTFVNSAALGDGIANFWPPAEGAAVELVRLSGSRWSYPLRLAWWLRRNRRHHDVVVALDNLTAALGAVVGRRLGGPPVLLQLGRPTLAYLRCQRDRGLAHPMRFAVRYGMAAVLVGVTERLADGIAAVSDDLARASARRNPVVRSIPFYGVDTERFRPAWSKADARRHLGLDPNTPVVLHRSRLAPEKDPEAFLRAIALLRGEGRRLVAAFVGGEADEMDRLAATHGVEMVSRRVDSFDDLLRWYVAADVDVQTSRAEGLGISPLESLACERPVVVSNVGGLPEVVDHGRVGALVAPGDAAAVAAAVAAYLDDDELARRHGREGRAHVEERYGARRTFRAWNQLARVVTGQGHGRRWRILFVDHETRLSGGQRDLVDLVRALPVGLVDVHVALPGEGELSAALAKHGAEIHVVPMAEHLRHVSRHTASSAPLRAMTGVLVDAARSTGGLSRLVRTLEPDLVHTNSMKAHLLAAPAARLARVPLVWHVRDVLDDGWLRRAFAGAAARLPHRVIAISHDAGRWLATDGAVSIGRGRLARLRVVHNGVRPDRPAPAEVEAWRVRLGASAGSPLVGIVGQLAAWKGQDTFVAAAALLAARRPDVRFAVVGECLFPENEADYVAELHRQVERLGLADRLVLTGGVSPVEPVMASLDVVVHASTRPEPFGRVIVEAMALGCPVVASALGAGPELVPPEAGEVIEPARPDLLADAVERLLGDCDGDGPGRSERSSAARRAAAAYDITATAEGVVSVWEELLGPRTGDR